MLSRAADPRDDVLKNRGGEFSSVRWGYGLSKGRRRAWSPGADRTDGNSPPLFSLFPSDLLLKRVESATTIIYNNNNDNNNLKCLPLSEGLSNSAQPPPPGI